MPELETLREEMVKRQLAARGIQDPAVLAAMKTVPREAFVPPDMVEFAYQDSALPIEEQQTISQPYIVALMTEALELSPDERVLEIGTGSGYAAAVLAKIADEVYTIERHGTLAQVARERYRELGYDNVHVRHGDGTLGWAEHAPYDAIVVAAGGPEVPQPLLDQLAVGGRLVIPRGPTPRLQELVRVRRVDEETYERENLGAVRFVPLIGEAGWSDPSVEAPARVPTKASKASVPELIRRYAKSFSSIETVDLGALMDRVGKARVVLLGEASHGTAEFYDMRARITQALIERHDFNIVAVEADWPDAAQVDRYVRDTPIEPPEEKPFRRFPTWMWANVSVSNFVEWLQAHNEQFESPDQRVGFYGLDLYSLYTSINSVLQYLEEIDPATARVARHRYACLTPWEQDPATYGAAALSGRYRECEPEVVDILQELLDKRMQYVARDGQRFFNAVQNARLVANAERYYRIMYYGSSRSWNLRDRHMFDTLQLLFDFRGSDARAVVWAHNSHLGNAAATEMSTRGQHNVGQLCREEYDDAAYLVGFGTDHGTVAAASDWDGPMEIKEVRPAHPQSYERLCHESGLQAFMLPLRSGQAAQKDLRQALLEERLERAIGIVYRPETELQSHYFKAVLPQQFDEYIWFDETQAVVPLAPKVAEVCPRLFLTNYGISLGLQAAGERQERAQKLNAFFRSYRSADRYEREAITHVMACTSRFAGEFIKK